MARSFFTDVKYCLYLDSILLIQLSFPVPVPVPVSHCVIPVALQRILISGKVSSCSLIFFIHFIAILHIFSTKCQLTTFVKKPSWDFNRIALNLSVNLRRIDISTTFQEYGISCHVFISSSCLSFSRALMFSSHTSYTVFVKFIPRYFTHFLLILQAGPSSTFQSVIHGMQQSY